MMIPIFRHVIGIDIDSQSLDIASTNAEDMEVGILYIFRSIDRYICLFLQTR